jgi:hypothetical protein
MACCGSCSSSTLLLVLLATLSCRIILWKVGERSGDCRNSWCRWRRSAILGRSRRPLRGACWAASKGTSGARGARARRGSSRRADDDDELKGFNTCTKSSSFLMLMLVEMLVGIMGHVWTWTLGCALDRAVLVMYTSPLPLLSETETRCRHRGQWMVQLSWFEKEEGSGELLVSGDTSIDVSAAAVAVLVVGVVGALPLTLNIIWSAFTLTLFTRNELAASSSLRDCWHNVIMHEVQILVVVVASRWPCAPPQHGKYANPEAWLTVVTEAWWSLWFSLLFSSSICWLWLWLWPTFRGDAGSVKQMAQHRGSSDCDCWCSVFMLTSSWGQGTAQL